MAAWLNQLIFANLMASVLTALMCLLRRFGRASLGSRWLYAGWLLVVLRLMLPVTVAVPVDIPEVISQPLSPILEHRATIQDESLEPSSVMTTDTGIVLSSAMLIGGIWIVGALAVAARMVYRNSRFRRSLQMRPLKEAEQKLLSECAGRHMLTLPRAFCSAHVRTPCLIGGIRPRLILPEVACFDEAMGFALLHEACHARAGDTRWALLRAMLCCLHWFNPMVWIAARLSRIDAELACDARVMARLSGKERYAYARTLVDAAEHRSPTLAMLTTGVSFDGERLRDRIAHILEEKKMKKTMVVLTAVLLIAVFGVSFAVSEPEILAPEYDWFVPAKAKDWAKFMVPVTVGSNQYQGRKINMMGEMTEDALILLDIRPGSYSNAILNGTQGKIKTEDIIVDPDDLKGQIAFAISFDDDGIPLFAEPRAGGKINAIFYNPMKVYIIHYSEDWCVVEIGQNTGYMETSALRFGSEKEFDMNFRLLETVLVP